MIKFGYRHYPIEMFNGRVTLELPERAQIMDIERGTNVDGYLLVFQPCSDETAKVKRTFQVLLCGEGELELKEDEEAVLRCALVMGNYGFQRACQYDVWEIVARKGQVEKR